MNRWRRKFAAAWVGLRWACKTQDSFYVHIPIAIAACMMAGWLRIEPWAWTAIWMSIGLVITAELLNSAAEQLVRVLHPEHDRRIGLALDAAAAGVLFASITAVGVGLITLGLPLLRLLIIALG